MALTPVQKELGKIAADYRRYRVVRSLARCWGALSLAGLAFLILHWTLRISFSWTVPAVLALGAGAAAWILYRNSRADVTLRHMARLVENDDPKLNSLLLAAAEQQPDRETGDLNFLQVRLLREALEANRRSPWQQKFVERLFFAQCSHVAALVALSVVLAWLAMVRPSHSTPEMARAGLEITPGNIEIERGSALAIVAHFAKTPPTEVTLVYRTPSGGESSLPMTRSLSDPLFGASFTDIREDTTYRVRHSGGNSPEYRIKVFDYPELKRADASLTYPGYTAFPPANIEDTRRLTAVEGTDVRYTFYLNKPVQSAVLRAKNGSAVIPLTNSASGEVIYESRFALKDSGTYVLDLVDEAGRQSKVPAEFAFVAQRNQAPKLKLVSPPGDQRVSALQEVRFEGAAEDDFGLRDYGIAYTFVGRDTELLSLADSPGQSTKPHESRTFSSLLSLEKQAAEVGEFVSFYIWAEDLGPDGNPRRTASDIYFAEVRPFEEIFREGNGGGSSSQQQQQQGQNNPAGQLLELQKEIITATWNLQRREAGAKPSEAFKSDAELVHESQSKAVGMADAMKERLDDDKSKALINTAIREMTSAAEKLGDAVEKNEAKPLAAALDSEQGAYQALLKLQAREFQVQRSQRSQQGGQQSGAQQRAQRQLDQLELSQEENRYETESQASPLQSAEQRETLQVLNRLKELARRQEDMSERLKELQIALNQAKTEEEKAELERQLKRLQEEQRQIVQDMDEVQQRMSQAENQSRMAEARQQLEQTREESRQAAEQLQQGNVGQALSSSSKAQEQLEKLSDEMRRSTSSQFAEEMQQMREQARELERKQEELTQKLQQNDDSRRRTLTNEGPREETLRALAQQQAALTNLLQNMRTVTEQAEAAEPLLSRQLYETLRRTSQANPEQTLEITSQLLERNFLPQALQTQQKATGTIRDLKEGIEKAANSVLGDEAESLRFAQAELEKLTDRVERELTAATRSAETNAPALGTNDLASASQISTNGLGDPRRYFPHLQTNVISGGARNSTNGTAAGSLQQNSDSESLASAQGQGQETQSSQRSRDGQAQEGAEGQREGQQQANSGNPQSPGQEQQGGRSGEPQVASNSESGQQQSSSSSQSERAGGEGQPGPQENRDSQPGGQQSGGGGARNFYEQWTNNGGARGGGGGGSINGPLTGDDYTSWSDSLRDLEEVLQDPQLRTDVARIRERARTIRVEFKRDATEPQWNLVQSDIVTPLRILQNRIAEQLARQESPDAVVPLDRDPVPSRYSELVSRYYETLGKD